MSLPICILHEKFVTQKQELWLCVVMLLIAIKVKPRTYLRVNSSYCSVVYRACGVTSWFQRYFMFLSNKNTGNLLFYCCVIRLCLELETIKNRSIETGSCEKCARLDQDTDCSRTNNIPTHFHQLCSTACTV